ncbi:hypothetical protein J7E71_24815 [Mesobacillus foraminis]|uniref:hypothetical protein n=1 Tax=Mesobacillus foraminis TaxID=279826 RepID=UPI001BE7C14E|nr:hypothetical protein [Mesobacillus foraminis]MBT2759099.1 hypothetical protein [Mesobacillus foraminis]
MKKYRVCYILEDRVETENIILDLNINAGEVFESLMRRAAASKFLKIRTEKGSDQLDTSLIRYIRVAPLK